MEHEECRKYNKNLFQISESIYKCFYHIVFLKILKLLPILTAAEELGMKKELLH